MMKTWKVPFNRPVVLDGAKTHLMQVLQIGKFCGDNDYTRKCHAWFEQNHEVRKALLTPSCTSALEISALLLDIQPGDEVILPSFTFVSSANAFVLRGATAVFIDVDPVTMNMDVSQIEAAITPKTKAIVPVHYAGVSCDMGAIMALAAKYQLYVVEDAAQGVTAKYHGRHLGTIGHLGCYSFHETKNYHCGEGGLLAINDPALIARAEIIREKGTNRSKFVRGEVDKYSWVDLGVSGLASEFNAAFLYDQLMNVESITQVRMQLWQCYHEGLSNIKSIQLPAAPDYAQHNAHIFFIKTESLESRDGLLTFLRERSIQATTHYVPLHLSEACRQYYRTTGKMSGTLTGGECLLRLPIFYGMIQEQVNYVVSAVKAFFDA